MGLECEMTGTLSLVTRTFDLDAVVADGVRGCQRSVRVVGRPGYVPHAAVRDGKHAGAGRVGPAHRQRVPVGAAVQSRVVGAAVGRCVAGAAAGRGVVGTAARVCRCCRRRPGLPPPPPRRRRLRPTSRRCRLAASLAKPPVPAEASPVEPALPPFEEPALPALPEDADPLPQAAVHVISTASTTKRMRTRLSRRRVESRRATRRGF